jgi:hypothetical protein
LPYAIWATASKQPPPNIGTRITAPVVAEAPCPPIDPVHTKKVILVNNEHALNVTPVLTMSLSRSSTPGRDSMSEIIALVDCGSSTRWKLLLGKIGRSHPTVTGVYTQKFDLRKAASPRIIVMYDSKGSVLSILSAVSSL